VACRSEFQILENISTPLRLVYRHACHKRKMPRWTLRKVLVDYGLVFSQVQSTQIAVLWPTWGIYAPAVTVSVLSPHSRLSRLAFPTPRTDATFPAFCKSIRAASLSPPQSASELYRPSDSRLSAKLVPTIASRGVSRGQRNGSLRQYPRLSIPELLSCTHESEWTPFLTHYFSENLVAPGIEHGPLDL
jgi:hypothetical protein